MTVLVRFLSVLNLHLVGIYWKINKQIPIPAILSCYNTEIQKLVKFIRIFNKRHDFLIF